LITRVRYSASSNIGTAIREDQRTLITRGSERSERRFNMPYLQLDTPFKHTAEQKRRLAMRLGEIY
jgi:hypothetical protein